MRRLSMRANGCAVLMVLGLVPSVEGGAIVPACASSILPLLAMQLALALLRTSRTTGR